MDSKNFLWIKFYSAFADKLLTYENDRKTLLDKLIKVFDNIGMKFQKLERDDSIIDIDPFTVFGMFNKGISEANRITIIKAFAEEFEISNSIEIPAVSTWNFTQKTNIECSADILKRVIHARNIQQKRFQKYGHPELHTNSELKGQLLEDAVELDNEAKQILIAFANKNKISARTYDRILRLARTIADLQNYEKVVTMHIAEAVSYRRVPPNRSI